MITIKKIAEVAKVSRGTVDKVLNNRYGVSDEVRKKVRDIADALNYRPNPIGKALANQNKRTNIGVILAPDYNPFVEDVKKGVEAARQELKDYGVNIELHVLTRLDGEEQLGIMKNMLRNNISAISLVPIEHKLVIECINEMVENGIPVVTFNSDIKNTKRLCFVGQDHNKGGRVAAELMGKVINRAGKVAIITSSYSLLCHEQRVEGFRTKLQESYDEIKIIDICENQDQDLEAFQCILSIFERVNDLRGIYITGGGVSGVGKALMHAGKEKEIKVISHDFVPGTIRLLKEGIIDFTIGQDPYTQGYLPIKLLYECLFSGKLPKSEFVETKIDIRVKENIDNGL